MDALIGKLTNLGYEVFGILLPGASAMLAATLLWIAAGALVVPLSMGALPQLSIEAGINAITSALEWSSLVATLLLFAGAYFVGHMLTWIGRGGKRHKKLTLSIHMLDTLRFRPPKGETSYSKELEHMRTWAARRLCAGDEEVPWRPFYLLAKTHLHQQAVPSLLAMYQNKYTLHRSLAVTAALVVWGAAVVLVAGTVSLLKFQGATPNWTGSIALLVAAALAVWGFSSSYLYNWKLWADYLIVETYLSLRGGGES